MPEGDTVWRTAHGLHLALAGERLTGCELRTPRLATADLTGRVVNEVVARGKHLMLRVDGPLTLHSHLGMDGAWRLYAAGERFRGGPGHQIRAILSTASRTAVGYRLAALDLMRSQDEDRLVGHLGPDLLGPDWDPEEARRLLLTAPTRPLGEALLDQRNLAGIGNVYKSELCFLIGVTPWLPVGETPSLERLVDLGEKLLRANRGRWDRVTTPSPHPGQRLWVYGRNGRPCLRCGAAVRRSGGQGPVGEERVTYWCPGCQRGPGPPVGRPSPSARSG
ncbi:DNA-formamidopyrimidine glycosylase family protein [Streptomyces sp. TP-A0874]|uniref:DNA-formamidopyrimidine glycosylase family protein n=1 Tax=Streptomyces sp. TP-A0874 TaxID=549819 RepID=UPI0008530D83|nr:DNA-formamidopyrimidine glycosylase family protein [Streptomyces sp. TP-A0874]